MTANIGQENLAALGRIALASTGVEMIAEQLIWELLGMEEPAGRALTEGARPSWLAERLSRVAKRTELNPELAKEVADFASAAKVMFQVRNETSTGCGSPWRKAKRCDSDRCWQTGERDRSS